MNGLFDWCARKDLNPQPSDPKSDALSSCATNAENYNLNINEE